MNLLKRLLAAIAAVGLVILVPQTAFAQDVPAPVTVDDAGSVYLLSPTWVKIITGLLLPLLLALLTKVTLNPVIKGALGIVLAAATALLIRWTTLDGSLVFDQAALEDIFMVYGVQLLTYLGLYRQANLNAKMAPRFGIG